MNDVTRYLVKVDFSSRVFGETKVTFIHTRLKQSFGKHASKIAFKILLRKIWQSKKPVNKILGFKFSNSTNVHTPAISQFLLS